MSKGKDGAAWQIGLSRPTQRGLYLDDVRLQLGRHLPPFLAPKPEWAAALAGNWQYDPDAPAASTRLPDTEPTTAVPLAMDPASVKALVLTAKAGAS